MTTKLSHMMYSSKQLRRIADIMDALTPMIKEDAQAYPDTTIAIYGEDAESGILGAIDARDFNEYYFYPIYADAGEEVQAE